MTPSDLIQAAMDFSSRPDLETELLNEFPALLRQAHSIQKYTYDIQVVHFANPTTVNGRFTIPILTQMPRLRDVYALRSYTAFTGDGTDISPFVGTIESGIEWKHSIDASPKKDYFGFIHPYTYHIMGNNLTVLAVPQETSLLEFEAVMWPTWDYNALADTYSTNSWILDKKPSLVQWYLSLYASRRAQKDDLIAQCRVEIQQQERSFLLEFAEAQYASKYR